MAWRLDVAGKRGILRDQARGVKANAGEVRKQAQLQLLV